MPTGLTPAPELTWPEVVCPYLPGAQTLTGDWPQRSSLPLPVEQEGRPFLPSGKGDRTGAVA